MAGAGMRVATLRLHVPPIPALCLLAGTGAGVLVPMLIHAALSRAGLPPWFGLAYWTRPVAQPA